MESTGLERSPSGGSCSDEDENSVLTRAEREPLIKHSGWVPRALLFKSYASHGSGRQRGISGESSMRQRNSGVAQLSAAVNLVVKLTHDIVETYQSCNSNFAFSSAFTRCLTNPSAPASNNGRDNVNSDLILYANAILVNREDYRRYIVKDMLGQGTFGQVCKCWSESTKSYVAVKVIKNQPAYYQQAHCEISICHMLNKNDPTDGHNIVRILDHFVFWDHLCLVFELLNANLYEMLKMNQFKGLSMIVVRRFTKQILDALTVLKEASVIHCDLKPENILLQQSLESAKIKLIDFGSACLENRTVYSYIQSRFYRSPEVLLQHRYTTAIDMWSLGCVAAELFLGLPLFPGACEYDLLQRMIDTLGCQPPDHVLHLAKNTNKFFKLLSAAPIMAREGQSPAYCFLNEAEFEAREQKKPQLGRRYFGDKKLEDIIMNYPMKRKMTPLEVGEERQSRRAFIDFLKGVLHFDPRKRWTPCQAVQHPFLTEEPYLGPFRPQSEKTPLIMGHGITMDHNPTTGHWFGAGLSPKNLPPVQGRHNNAGYHAMPSSHASSYSSAGSYGSYGDGTGIGSSVGSYGETQGMNFGYSTTPVTGPSGQGGSAGAVVSISPETYRRMQVSNIPPSLGLSPSGFRPSLGASPSHNNYQVSPGSNYHVSPNNFLPSQLSFPGSPGSNYYGSPAGQSLASPSSPSHSSPSRHGPSALGKKTYFNNHNNVNKRRQWPIPPATASNNDLLALHWLRLQQQNASGNDISLRMPGTHSLPSMPRRSRNGSVPPLPVGNLYAPGSLGALLNSPDAHEIKEEIPPPPDPRDWDPAYSDDLLLEGDSNEGSSSGITTMDVSEMSNDLSRLGTGAYSGPEQTTCTTPTAFQHGHTMSGDQFRLNETLRGSGEFVAGSLQNGTQGQQQFLHGHGSPHGTYANAPQMSPTKVGAYHGMVSPHQWRQLPSQHYAQFSDSITNVDNPQRIMDDCGYNLQHGPLIPTRWDPWSGFAQGSGGSCSNATVPGPLGFGPDSSGPPRIGLPAFPAPFIPTLEPIPHQHLDPNVLLWGYNSYTHHYQPNVSPHETFAVGRRPDLSLPVTGRPIPPTAPSKSFGSKRSV